MKAIDLLIVVSFTLAAAGCDRYDDNPEIAHHTKMEAFSDRYGPKHRTDTTNLRGGLSPDTVLFVSGVAFPEDYDWRRDTSYGDVSASIVLFRDKKKILEIPAGKGAHVSPAPDLHHLFDGHIYTEFTDRNNTMIGRDGETLFTYSGRETLHGLLVDGDDIWTLGQNKDKEGFALRRNGKVVLEKENGHISGRMTERPDYPGGALYSDSGHMYFSYWRYVTENSTGKAWFIVEDGRETQVMVGREENYDIRVIGGELVVESITPSQSCFNEYYDGGRKATVVSYYDGTILVSYPGTHFENQCRVSYYFFSCRNACLAGKNLYLAITPCQEGKSPFLWKNGEIFEFEMNGFLTAVSASIIPRDKS